MGSAPGRCPIPNRGPEPGSQRLLTVGQIRRVADASFAPLSPPRLCGLLRRGLLAELRPSVGAGRFNRLGRLLHGLQPGKAMVGCQDRPDVAPLREVLPESLAVAEMVSLNRMRHGDSRAFARSQDEPSPRCGRLAPCGQLAFPELASPRCWMTVPISPSQHGRRSGALAAPSPTSRRVPTQQSPEGAHGHPGERRRSQAGPSLRRVLCAAALVALVAWLVLDVSQRREQLVSLGGFAVLVVMLFLCSKHHAAVSWRAVFWGLGLQFVLGVLIIRTEPGFQAFQWLGAQIQTFLNYTTAGSSFVFGDKLIQEVFAFQALPSIVFFSCVMSILYYLGVMQFFILKLSWLLQITMGTAATESLSMVGNIFVGMTEAPLLIRPYLLDMTRSEIHAVMTGGFATIAGSVMGVYISFGIDASSLIAASVMAAPCALAMAKLVYPEVEESKFRSRDGEKNVLEAAGNGAAASVGLVANIAANLIAFLAVLEFIDAALSWLGGMVDLPELSFQLICSYVLVPLAFLLGASWEDAPLVAELLGIKIFLNEFVAYQQLSTYKQKRLDGLPEWNGTQKQWISASSPLAQAPVFLPRPASMAPQRKSEFSSIVLRALFTGACVSLINACVAGILYVPRDAIDCLQLFGSANLTSTSFPVYVCCSDLFGRQPSPSSRQAPDALFQQSIGSSAL
uniref:Sodium/nucleoside cotransporter n=1 Tax=Varanus komodoensis TaxID=61221 RepID=A0A8D2KV05_VARKO